MKKHSILQTIFPNEKPLTELSFTTPAAQILTPTPNKFISGTLAQVTAVLVIISLSEKTAILNAADLFGLLVPTLTAQILDSVGIHLSGDFTYNLPTDNQIESAALLIAYLCESFNIPTDRKHILGHRETIETACPGNMLFNLLDVIVGKANWYRFNNADIVDSPAEPPTFHFKPRAGMLSEHFSEKEFACPCCGVVNVNPKLIELLERLRWNIGGYPLYIYSGCRCKIFNTNYGGKLDSQHLIGNAADLAYPKQLSFGEFKWYIEQLPFDAIGINLDFIHVDIRNGGVGSKLFLLGGVDND